MSFGPRRPTPSTASNSRSKLAGGQVHALDAPARIVARLRDRPKAAVDLSGVFEAAVVADVDRAIRSDGRTVGPAAQLRHHVDAPVGRDATERAARDLHQQHRAVVHGDRAFGELQAAGDVANLHACLLVAGARRRPAAHFEGRTCRRAQVGSAGAQRHSGTAACRQALRTLARPQAASGTRKSRLMPPPRSPTRARNCVR